jgi:hypothetical protein
VTPRLVDDTSSILCHAGMHAVASVQGHLDLMLK